MVLGRWRRPRADDGVHSGPAEQAHDGSGPLGSGDAPPDEVLEVDIVGSQFTVDTVIARLESEGVEVVRSSPFEVNVIAGGLARAGQHKLVFRASDRDAVAAALRDAHLL